MANYIGNSVNILEEDCKKNELKEFLIKNLKTLDNKANIHLKNLILDDEKIWFDWSWHEKNTRLFDIENLETDTMYFYTRWDSSMSTIIEFSRLFSDIEFVLNWHPRELFDYSFGYARIKSGEVTDYNSDIPQEYINETDELLRDDNREDKNSNQNEPNRIFLVDRLPF